MTKLGFQMLSAGALATPDNVVELARKAEALGFDAIGITDHIVIPRRVASRYPYSASGRLFASSDTDYLEPLATLGFLAGATKRIRLGPSVLVLPYRNPVLTAKMLATLDVHSGGRLFVGVGAGWLTEEFVAVGAPPFAQRGAVTDEWLEILTRLWTEAYQSFEGRFFRFQEVGCFPKPVQKPHPPLLVGGHTRAAIRRAARYGQTWHASRVPAKELPSRLKYLQDQLRALARPPGSCGFSVVYGARVVGPGGDTSRREAEDPGGVFVGTAAQVAEELKPIVDLGPTLAIFDCRTATYLEVLETLERLAGDVWPRLERSVA